jgi:hypothetical protein
MGQDGFGTLSARLMERGTERVRAVLDEAGPEPTSVSFDLTYSSRPATSTSRGTSADVKAAGPHADRVYDVPPAIRTSAFAKVPPAPGQPNGAPHRASGFGGALDGVGAHADKPEIAAREKWPPMHSDAAPVRGDRVSEPERLGLTTPRAPTANPFARVPVEAPMRPPEVITGSVPRQAPEAITPFAPRPVPEAATAAASQQAPRGAAQNPVGVHHRTLEERRAGSGANLTIKQPQAGDMSQVTVTMNGVTIDHTTPQKGGQAPSSVTYERRTLAELAAEAEALANGERGEPVWIETPSYSGPDRRSKDVSPEIERRKSVPPRIKVGVRLEQERYLRLKLAALQHGRTQQDIVTCAIDGYLDEIGVDRFVRIAMGFGVESDGSKLDTGT